MSWVLWALVVIFIVLVLIFGYFIFKSGQKGEDEIKKAWWESLDEKIDENKKK